MFNVKITYLKKKLSHTEQKVYNSPYAKVYIDANRIKKELKKNNIGAKITKLTKNKNK